MGRLPAQNEGTPAFIEHTEDAVRNKFAQIDWDTALTDSLSWTEPADGHVDENLILIAKRGKVMAVAKDQFDGQLKQAKWYEGK